MTKAYNTTLEETKKLLNAIKDSDYKEFNYLFQNSKNAQAMLRDKDSKLILLAIVMAETKSYHNGMLITDPKSSWYPDSGRILRDLLADPEIRKNIADNDNAALSAAAKSGNWGVVKMLLEIPSVMNSMGNASDALSQLLQLGLMQGHLSDYEKGIKDELLRKYPKLNALAEKVNKQLAVKRAGHIFGLSGAMDVAGKKMPFEGASQSYTLPILLEKIGNYTASANASAAVKKRFDKINTAFKCALDMDRAQKSFESKYITKEELMKAEQGISAFARYKNGELGHLPVGAPEHGFGITIYKGYLILTNRGANAFIHNKTVYGTVIYKIRDEKNLLNLGQDHSWMQSWQTVFEAAMKVVDIQKPIALFAQTGQKHGTCTYVNELASNEGMLCLLALDEQGKLDDRNIQAYAQEPNNRAAYKDFTKFARDSEAQKLAHDIRLTKGDTFEALDEREFYYDLVKNILLQHPGNTKQGTAKYHAEIERGLVMMRAFPESYQIRFAGDNDLSQKCGPLLTQLNADLPAPVRLESGTIRLSSSKISPWTKASAPLSSPKVTTPSALVPNELKTIPLSFKTLSGDVPPPAAKTTPAAIVPPPKPPRPASMTRPSAATADPRAASVPPPTATTLPQPKVTSENEPNNPYKPTKKRFGKKD